MTSHLTISAVFLCLFMNATFAISDDKKKKASSTPDQDICLQITGDLAGSIKANDGKYLVKLIQNNQIIEQTEVNSKASFKLNLKRNSFYTIRIEKEGYIPRLVSVNTSLPENIRKTNLYRFHFDMELFSESFSKYFDSDDIDFPIALIAYDKAKGVFHYDKKYTTRIQQKMHNMASRD